MEVGPIIPDINTQLNILCTVEESAAFYILTCLSAQVLGSFSLGALRPRQNDRYVSDDIFKCIF